MQFKQLIGDDDAVSPVIGVILMVAITVILAAVIGTFVLGLGDQVSNTSPTASFTFDFTDEASTPADADVLAITHDGGDKIDAGRLAISTQGTQIDVAAEQSQLSTTTSTSTFQLENADEFGSTSEISAGSTIFVGTAISDDLNSETVRVIWSSSSGGDTATLGKWTGPGA